MHESFRTRLWRLGFNLFPAYRRTGGRITLISHDWRTVKVRLPLNWKTRNYVGTLFGGSIYGAVDPIYMVMLIKLLGPEYIVWDKAATIYFKKPGRSTLFAEFTLSDDELATIRHLTATNPSVDRQYTVEFRDQDGTICAVCEKIIYIRRKDVRE